MKLPVAETFYSLQGEGFNTGKAAFFIRIAGCNIGCSWCDSKEYWKKQKSLLLHINTLVSETLHYNAKSVVITGGEPLAYNLTNLTKALKKHKIETYLETCGCYKLTGTWNWICLSAKTQHPPLPHFFKIANELKIVIYTVDDFKWADYCSNKVSKKCILYLQPEWSRFNKNINKIIDYIKTNPKWRLSLQTHKFLGIP